MKLTIKPDAQTKSQLEHAINGLDRALKLLVVALAALALVVIGVAAHGGK